MKKDHNPELAPLPGRAGVDKIKKFGWTVKDEPGQLRMIKKTDINIDTDYQRTPGPSKINDLASSWSWVACGAITVAYRDGKFWAIDGQHRVLAALRRSDISDLPCVVFRSEGQRDEARGFFNANDNRRPMSALDKFRALLVAGDETAIFVQGTLDKLGLTPTSDSSPGEIKCIGLVYRLASVDRENFQRVITFCAELCGKSAGITDRLLSGIDYLHKHCGDGLDDKRMATRLVDAGPGRLLEGAVRAASYFAVGGARVYAQGFLDVINKGLHVKYELDGARAE